MPEIRTLIETYWIEHSQQNIAMVWYGTLLILCCEQIWNVQFLIKI